MNPEPTSPLRGRLTAALVVTFLSTAITTVHAAPLLQAPYVLVPMGASPTSVAIGDVNGDGRPDIVCGRPEIHTPDSYVSVALGSSSGGYEPPAEYLVASGNPLAVAIADFDEDGIGDVAAVATAGSTVTVLFGSGTGNLERRIDIEVNSSTKSIAIGDVDGDGHADIVVACRFDASHTGTAGSVCVLYGNGDGTFRPRVDLETATDATVAIGDMNGDGRLDLVVLRDSSPTVADVYLNGGADFSLSSSTEAGWAALGPVIADFDGDGHMDLAVAHYGPWGPTLLFGDGKGGFSRTGSVEVGADNRALACADLNGDGIVDLIVHEGSQTSCHGIWSCLGNGDGTFSVTSSLATWDEGFDPGFAIADVDADGKPDLIVAHLGADDVSLHFGNGDGTFGAPFTRLDAGRGIADARAVDFDGDGRMDLVTTVSLPLGLAILHGSASDGFDPPSYFKTGVTPYGLVVTDLDGDGLDDILVANIGSSFISFFRGGPGGAFSPQQTISAPFGINSVLVTDWDHDGRPDLIVAGGDYGSICFSRAPAVSSIDAPSPIVGLMRNLGNGSFSPAAPLLDVTAPVIGLGDFDRDGFPDLAVADSHGGGNASLRILFGSGDGTGNRLADLGALPLPSEMTVGDEDGDGIDDIIVTNYGICQSPASVSIVRSRGDGTFDPRVDYPVAKGAVRPAIADVNGDGIPDLLVACHEAKSVTVLLGIGGGRLGHRLDYGVDNFPSSLAIADFDGDAAPDLYAGGDGCAAAAAILHHVPPGGPPLAARAFVRGDHRALPLSPGTTFEVRVEPVGGAFRNADVDPASIRLAASSALDAPSIAAS
ncbi:MAG: FG-GAP repeat domain-containing protein, partial [Hyphomicrobiales bacterium]